MYKIDNYITTRSRTVYAQICGMCTVRIR